ncbi:glycosyltransferase family 2 protein [Marinobacterium lacunae]|uniref:glycosyltransferase family 2 protein n=1 Tax=Marinobacterium lacunae TaxID=1232683 RepID=UPI00055E0B0E|nr:glycosyltransferase family 2 protein [Marinobacterium lacunae]
MENNITAIVLTYNEELHIGRCLESLLKFCSAIVVVDSYSDDSTLEICKSFHKVQVVQNPFVNQALQMQWALDHTQINTRWTIKVDADEYFDEKAIRNIKAISQGEDCAVAFRRRVVFNDRWIRFGGTYPQTLVRMWPSGLCQVENRWMDEHMIVKGMRRVVVKGGFYDHNLRNIEWWTNKHNSYSTREMIQYYLEKLNPINEEDKLGFSLSTYVKRNLKKAYNRFPKLFRALFYFSVRYFFLLGFLDGKSGFYFHFFQGFWYRALIDFKIDEARIHAYDMVSFRVYIKKKYGLNI